VQGDLVDGQIGRGGDVIQIEKRHGNLAGRRWGGVDIRGPQPALRVAPRHRPTQLRAAVALLSLVRQREVRVGFSGRTGDEFGGPNIVQCQKTIRQPAFHLVVGQQRSSSLRAGAGVVVVEGSKGVHAGLKWLWLPP
jgi:hypothetical protein